MPTIVYEDQKISCEKGENLRAVLLKNGIYPHNGASRYVNCFGIGSCGTCAVHIEGQVNEMCTQERIRLSLAPHNPENGLRLSCQVTVQDDIKVKKYAGFWGQEVNHAASSSSKTKR